MKTKFFSVIILAVLFTCKPSSTLLENEYEITVNTEGVYIETFSRFSTKSDVALSRAASCSPLFGSFVFFGSMILYRAAKSMNIGLNSFTSPTPSSDRMTRTSLDLSSMMTNLTFVPVCLNVRTAGVWVPSKIGAGYLIMFVSCWISPKQLRALRWGCCEALRVRVCLAAGNDGRMFGNVVPAVKVSRLVQHRLGNLGEIPWLARTPPLSQKRICEAL